jgi:hypothetical protein
MASYPAHIATLARHPSGFAPIVMSLAALALVMGTIMAFGTARQPDEGAAAHLYQLLIVAQVPLLGVFAWRWLRQDLRAGLAVLALQALALGAALVPVWYYGL